MKYLYIHKIHANYLCICQHVVITAKNCNWRSHIVQLVLRWYQRVVQPIILCIVIVVILSKVVWNIYSGLSKTTSVLVTRQVRTFVYVSLTKMKCFFPGSTSRHVVQNDFPVVLNVLKFLNTEFNSWGLNNKLVFLSAEHK